MKEIRFKYQNWFPLLGLWFLFLCIQILLTPIIILEYFYEPFPTPFDVINTFIYIAVALFMLSVFINNSTGKAIFHNEYVEIITGRKHREIFYNEIMKMEYSYKIDVFFMGLNRRFIMKLKTRTESISIGSSLGELWSKNYQKLKIYKPKLRTVYEEIYFMRYGEKINWNE